MKLMLALGAMAFAWAQSAPPEQARKLLDDGKFREAEPLVRQMLADGEAKQGADSEEVAVALDFLLEVFSYRAKAIDPEERQVIDRALALREKLSGPDSRLMADTLVLAANLLWQSREPIESRTRAERAVAIYESLSGDASLNHDFAGALQALGHAQRDNNDLAAAKASFGKALALYDKAGYSGSSEMATCLSNFGGIQLRLLDFDGARASYTNALAIEEKTLGPNHPNVSFTLSNLGATLTRSGHYAEAVAPLERSLRLTESIFGADSTHTATSLANLAQAMILAGRYDDGIPMYERARDIYSRTLGEEGTSFAGLMSNYAVALAYAGRTKQASNAAVRAENIVRAYYGAVMRNLPEREALLNAAARSSGVRANGLQVLLRLAVAQADPKPALDQLIRSRADVFDEMASRHRAAVVAGDPEIDALSSALSRARDHLAALAVRGPESASASVYAAQLKRTRDEKEQAERRLAARSERFRQELAGDHAGLDEIAAALPPGAALVSYARYSHADYLLNTPSPNPSARPVFAYMAFVLRAGDSAPAAIPLGTAREIDDLVHAVRDKISQEAMDPGRAPQRSEQIYRDAAARLRQKIWDPLVPHLASSDRVFIVADGEINLVSFAALPAGTTAYLIEKGPLVHYLSAERDLLSPDSRVKGQGLLAVENPSFDHRPSVETAAAHLRDGPANCSAFQSMRFDRLPASAREVAEIAALWKRSGAGDALTLTGPLASKAAFRQAGGTQTGDPSGNARLFSGIGLPGRDIQSAAAFRRGSCRRE